MFMAFLEEGVDEWSDGRAFSDDQQAGDNDDESEKRSNPALLAATQKCPEFFDEATHIQFLALVFGLVEFSSCRCCSLKISSVQKPQVSTACSRAEENARSRFAAAKVNRKIVLKLMFEGLG
jgi:hypothetical protein